MDKLLNLLNLQISLLILLIPYLIIIIEQKFLLFYENTGLLYDYTINLLYLFEIKNLLRNIFQVMKRVFVKK